MNSEGLKHNIELVYTLGTMDLKQKYQNSTLGMLWSFLKPLLQFIVYYFVFGVTLKIDESADYPLRLFFGITVWTLFTDGTSMGLSSYLGKKTLVTKVRVNMILIPISAFYTAALNFAINLGIFLLLYHFLMPSPFAIYTVGNFLQFVVSLVLYGVSIVSLNIVLATLNALFRDIQSIWELLMMYGVFLMPIIYPISLDEAYMPIYYFFNPVAFPLINLRTIFFGAGNFLWSDSKYVVAYIAGITMWVMLAWLVNAKLKHKVADYL